MGLEPRLPERAKRGRRTRMKTRKLFLGASTLLLLATPAIGQTMYDDERRTYDDQRRDVYDAQQRMHDQTTRETREQAARVSLPPRAYKMDVAEVDHRYEQSFRQTITSRKLGASDWRELRRQRSEIDDLKGRIRAGHTVSPSEVDRALGLDGQQRPGY